MDGYLTRYRAKMRNDRNNVFDCFTFIDKSPFEKVHLNFCKSILGTKKSASNIGV